MKANTAGMFTLNQAASARTEEIAGDPDVVEIAIDEASEAVPAPAGPRSPTLAFFRGQAPPPAPESPPAAPEPRVRKNTIERFNDEMAVLDGPLQENDVEYYDEPQPRRWRVPAIGLALFALSCGGYLAVARHHAAVNAEATPAAAPAAAVATAPSPAAANSVAAGGPAVAAAIEKPAPAPEALGPSERASGSHHQHASRHAGKSHHHHHARAARHGARTL